MEDNKMTLADFSRKLQDGEGINPIASDGAEVIERKTEVVETKPEETINERIEATSHQKALADVEVFDPRDASKFVVDMQRTANLTEKGGIIPEMSEEEIADMNKKLEGADEMYMMYTEKDAIKCIEALKRHGYTTEEIDQIPYLKILSLGKALIEDEAEGKVGELKDKIDSDGNVVIDTETGPKRIDDTVKVDSAVAGVNGVDTPKVKDEDKLTKEEEDELIEKSLNEMLETNKKVYIKYADKPLNSYRREKESKAKKLISRQKRGNKVEVFLPNSNIMLEVFEIHQPMIINEIMALTQMSQDIMVKKRVVEAILERSTAMCSDGMI